MTVRRESTAIAEVVAARTRDVRDFPQPGVLFRDLTPLFADATAFRTVIDALAATAQDYDVVAGVEARGFLLAAAIGYAARAGVVPVRKAGKLPGPVISETYALEYGEATIEMRADALRPGARVLVVDDVLATGGTLAATLRLLRRVGAEITGSAVILELIGLGGRAAVAPDDVIALRSL